MGKKLEPLLKDEVETFPFLEEKKVKKGFKINWDRQTITTIVIAALVLWFVGNSLYAYYVGFKYYDLRYEKDTPTETVKNTTNK